MTGTPFAGLGQSNVSQRARWLAPLSIILGSLITLIPFKATVPLLPPFGLMMLLAWRLHRPDLLKPWAPLLLGFVDDMVSGQPLGNAMFFWTVSFIAIDVLDTRIVWRDFLQDWLLAAGAIGFCLIGGRLVATPLNAHVDTVLLIQILISIALFPVLSRLVSRLDQRRKWQ
ncbi:MULTISPECIES: rod shape-determining protein MreD [unclassified Sphingomonas]|uniref:rod shape-determining protein MreD n=1 Tax=unclassified Sphingomonas TaxID=196159 RepID=UPI000836B897|nr:MULTISPECIES: rod shape-determining protein MreD [unclassified Sphingomonas]